MIRALGILTAVAALSAVPVASAGSSQQPPPRAAQVVVLIGDMASKAPPKPRGRQLTTDTSDGTSNTIMWSSSLKRPNGIIAILIG